jgi:hypothetical protein
VPIQNQAGRFQPLLEGVRSHAAPLANTPRPSADREHRSAEPHREHRRAEPRREHRPEGRQVHRQSQRRG